MSKRYILKNILRPKITFRIKQFEIFLRKLHYASTYFGMYILKGDKKNILYNLHFGMYIKFTF